jgi:hypothetical protein
MSDEQKGWKERILEGVHRHYDGILQPDMITETAGFWVGFVDGILQQELSAARSEGEARGREEERKKILGKSFPNTINTRMCLYDCFGYPKYTMSAVVTKEMITQGLCGLDYIGKKLVDGVSELAENDDWLSPTQGSSK